MFLFEHAAFVLVAVVNACVGSVPTSVQEQIDREARIGQSVLWEAKPLRQSSCDEVERCQVRLLKALQTPTGHDTQLLPEMSI